MINFLMANLSPVTGVSGAVRIQRLSGVSMSAAEAHGKRLDVNGKARAIYDAAPVTSHSLDLCDLYTAHVDGAKVQKSNTKALHMLLQFPKELMNGEDGQAMLDHAQAFATSIFGDDAVFADRVDRDEKSRHVVDLFIAPKYEKVTKRMTQTAISTSKHLKDLAAERGKAPTLRGQGQALQDAWFEYLRDEVGLDVRRGAEKKQPGSDWKAAEELELERLRDEQAAATRELETVNEAVAQKKTTIANLETSNSSLRQKAATLRARFQHLNAM